MSGTTSQGYPYPDDTDPVAQGGAAIRNLANAIDSKIRVASGTATITFANANTGNIAITYPAGRFAGVPRPWVVNNTGGAYVPSSGGATATGFTAYLFTPGGNAITASPTINWGAVWNYT